MIGPPCWDLLPFAVRNVPVRRAASCRLMLADVKIISIKISLGHIEINLGEGVAAYTVFTSKVTQIRPALLLKHLN